MPFRSAQAGATIVELLVYLFLLGVLTAGSLTMLFSLDTLFGQYRAKQALFTSGVSLLDRVLVEVREADQVTVADSVFGSSTAATVALQDDLSSVRIVWNGDRVEVWRDGVYGGLLHSAAVTVTAMRAYHYEINNIDLVRVELELRAAAGDYTETMSLQGGAIIRGSYVQP